MKFSAFFTTKIQGDTEKIDASFVTLSDYEMTLSMKNVALFAFTTSSSAATIPITLKTVTDELGVKKDVSSFVIPVGATINMDGTAIMQGLATMFIASTVGETLPDGFQRSEFLLDHGFIDQIIHRKELKDKLANLLSLLLKRAA